MSSSQTLGMAVLSFVLCALLTDQLIRNGPHRKEVGKRYTVKTKQTARLIREADERLKWSAKRIGKALLAGDFTSVEITLAFIVHLEKINLYTNGMIASRFDRALREAREADDILAMHRKNKTSPSSPFVGVPLFSKEVFEMPGMPFSSGLTALAKRYGRNTCFALGKAQQLGGVIVLGSGNISEACMWMESNNHIYGRTNNVYDTSRTVGGSSGGTACTVSALGAPFAITSDVGGSTRIPSLFNGLFGVKPTGGTVSNAGTCPSVINRVNWFCQLGPCCRYAEDLLPLLKLLAGPAGQYDPQCKEFQTKSNIVERWISDQVPLSKLRIYDCRRQPGSSGFLYLFQSLRHQAMIRAHDQVVAYLRAQGSRVEEVDFPELSEGFDIWGALMARETKERPFRYVLAEGKPGAGSLLWAFKELFLWLGSLGQFSDHTLPGVALAALEAVDALAVGKNKRMCDKAEKLKQAISGLLGENGVMIMPNLPTPAPSHGWAFLLQAADSAATGLINILEFPSCAIPLGLDERGLPVGVQVIANHGNDHLCISVARALQDGGIAAWVPPRLRED